MKATPPKVLGGDLSGTVSALGAGVAGSAIGDEVLGGVDEFNGVRGSHAERGVAPAAAVSRKPAAVSREQAASLTMAGLTPWQALTRHAPVRPGHRLLVLGGSGGVGSMAVQIGRALGAHVTATASGANLGLLLDLGADACIDHRKTDLATLAAPSTWSSTPPGPPPSSARGASSPGAARSSPRSRGRAPSSAWPSPRTSAGGW